MSELSRESALLEIIYSLEKAFWELLGAGAKATVSIVGEELYERLKSLSNVDLEGVSEEEALREISRVLTEDMGVAKSVDISRDGSKFTAVINNCVMLDVERQLIGNNIKPFLCPFLNLIAYVVRSRGSKSTSLGDIRVEGDKCYLSFEELK